MSDGGKGSSGSGSHDYYGSVIGLLGWGPAYELKSLLVDGKEVWVADSETPILRSEQFNPYTFDVEGYGRCHFYWGTEDQVPNDPVTLVAERDHPAYRRRVFIVLEDFLFGRERVSAPDVSVVWSREPAQSVLPLEPLDLDGQASPVAFALEVLTDPLNGLGLSADLFDLTSWTAEMGRAWLNAADEFLTISLDDKITGRRLLSELADYGDFWFRANDAGKLEIGRWSDQDGELPVITMADLMEGSSMSFEPEGIRDTSGQVTVEWINPAKVFEDDHVTFQNGARREQFSQDNLVELQRPWIRRGEQAGRMAARVGEQVAQPGGQLSLEVRETRAVALVPGARFLFRREDLDWEIQCRVVSRTGDGDEGGAVQITAEKERVLTEDIFRGGAAEFESEDAFQIEDLDYWDPVQLPAALSNKKLYRLAFLAGRTQGIVTDGRPCLRAEASLEFQPLGQQRSWAVPFELDQAYAATVAVDDETGSLLVSLQPGAFGFQELDAAPTEDEIADDKWLVFLISDANSDDLEVCTLRSIEQPTAGVYPLHVWRARFGTERLDFAAGDRAYILQRGDIKRFEWRGGKARALSGTPTIQTKLIAATASESVAVADATIKTLTLRDQTGENEIADLYSGQTALQIETAALDARVDALENPPPP